MATRKAPGAEPIERPEFEVVGDELVCHPYDDLRLSLVVPLPTIDRWTEINDTANGWREQLSGWQAEIIPAEVMDSIRKAANGDGVREVELCRRWCDGLDARLGKVVF